MRYVYLKDKFVPENEAFISIKERGFMFGDGVFDKMILSNSKPYKWQSHINRLESGLEALKIDFPTDKLHEISIELIEKNNASEGFIRFSISRGIGGAGYFPSKNSVPTLIIETMERPNSPEFIDLHISDHIKPPPSVIPVHFKNHQGLNSILASIEAQENDCQETLLLGIDGQVCEGSTSNIFWVKDEVIYTPSVESGILPGIMRETILENSPLKVKEGIYQLGNLKNADEIFMTNVNWRVMPVRKINKLGLEFKERHTINRIKSLVTKKISSGTM